MSVVVYDLREALLTDRGETRPRPASVAVGSKAQPGRESGTNRGMTGVGTCRTVSLNAPRFGSHTFILAVAQRRVWPYRLAADPFQFMHSPA
jgi:hypothetical protein